MVATGGETVKGGESEAPGGLKKGGAFTVGAEYVTGEGMSAGGGGEIGGGIAKAGGSATGEGFCAGGSILSSGGTAKGGGPVTGPGDSVAGLRGTTGVDDGTGTGVAPTITWTVASDARPSLSVDVRTKV